MNETEVIRALKALANRKRFAMVQEIAAAGELSCGQVGELFDLSQPTVSHHLKILTDAGLLVVRESGQHRITSVNHQLLESLARLLPSRPGGKVARGAPRRR
jgi:ArsR family transcriptional regulator